MNSAQQHDVALEEMPPVNRPLIGIVPEGLYGGAKLFYSTANDAD